jgi:hypothetical protein
MWCTQQSDHHSHGRVNPRSEQITLTSGTTGYGRSVIVGASVTMNTNTLWDAGAFLSILTRELGHTLGLGDADSDALDGVMDGLVSGFFDDNYDGSSQAMVEETLTNAYSSQIDPFDPEAFFSSARVHAIAVSLIDGGIGGAPNLLMEQSSGGVTDLTNDEFAARQYLYPFLATPEPSSVLLLALSGLLALRRQRARSR